VLSRPIPLIQNPAHTPNSENSGRNGQEEFGTLNVRNREAFQAAIQSAQAAGYSDWLAADEAALDYIATRIAPKLGGATEVIAKRLRVEKLWPLDQPPTPRCGSLKFPSGLNSFCPPGFEKLARKW